MPVILPKASAVSHSNTVQSRSARLNDLQPRPAKVHVDSPLALTDLNQPPMLALIRQAMSDVGLKQEAAAALAGVKPSQFSEALNGRGNFGATWIWAQDDRFLLRFLELVQEARQLTPENQSAIRRRRIVELIELLLQECA